MCFLMCCSQLAFAALKTQKVSNSGLQVAQVTQLIIQLQIMQTYALSFFVVECQSLEEISRTELISASVFLHGDACLIDAVE